jgi:hypothetical protein
LLEVFTVATMPRCAQIGSILAAELAALAAAREADQVSDAWEPSPALAAFADPAALMSADPAALRQAATLIAGATGAIRGDNRAAERAARRALLAQQAPTPPPLVDVAALLTTPAPPLDWVLPGVLPSGEVGLLVDTDGGGKSALLAELALAVAMGVPWAAPDPQQPGLIPAPTAGRVLYIAGEDDTAEYHRRFAAARATLRLPAPPAGQVCLWALESRPLHLMEAHRQAATPAETPAAAQLADVIRQISPRLVVLDPLIMLHGLSEADPQHMDSLMRLLIRLARASPAVRSSPRTTPARHRSATGPTITWSGGVPPASTPGPGQYCPFAGPRPQNGPRSMTRVRIPAGGG